MHRVFVEEAGEAKIKINTCKNGEKLVISNLFYMIRRLLGIWCV